MDASSVEQLLFLILGEAAAIGKASAKGSVKEGFVIGASALAIVKAAVTIYEQNVGKPLDPSLITAIEPLP